MPSTKPTEKNLNSEKFVALIAKRKEIFKQFIKDEERTVFMSLCAPREFDFAEEMALGRLRPTYGIKKAFRDLLEDTKNLVNYMTHKKKAASLFQELSAVVDASPVLLEEHDKFVKKAEELSNPSLPVDQVEAEWKLLRERAKQLSNASMLSSSLIHRMSYIVEARDERRRNVRIDIDNQFARLGLCVGTPSYVTNPAKLDSAYLDLKRDSVCYDEMYRLVRLQEKLVADLYYREFNQMLNARPSKDFDKVLDIVSSKVDLSSISADAKRKEKDYAAKTAYKYLAMQQKKDSLTGMVVLDLASGPGASAQAALDLHAKSVTAVTLDVGKQPERGVDVSCSMKQRFYSRPGQTLRILSLKTGDGDITVTSNRECFEVDHYDQVFADGAATAHRAIAQIPDADIEVIYAELLIALKALKTGGTLVIKLRLFDYRYTDLFICLAEQFESVKCVKPTSSGVMSPEFYLKAEGFSPGCVKNSVERMVRLVDSYSTMCEQLKPEREKTIQNMRFFIQNQRLQHNDVPAAKKFTLPTVRHVKETVMFAREEGGVLIYSQNGKYEVLKQAKKGGDNSKKTVAEKPDEVHEPLVNARDELKDDMVVNHEEQRDFNLEVLTEIDNCECDVEKLSHLRMSAFSSSTCNLRLTGVPAPARELSAIFHCVSLNSTDQLNNLPFEVKQHVETVVSKRALSAGVFTVARTGGVAHVVAVSEEDLLGTFKAFAKNFVRVCNDNQLYGFTFEWDVSDYGDEVKPDNWLDYEECARLLSAVCRFYMKVVNPTRFPKSEFPDFVRLESETQTPVLTSFGKSRPKIITYDDYIPAAVDEYLEHLKYDDETIKKCLETVYGLEKSKKFTAGLTMACLEDDNYKFYKDGKFLNSTGNLNDYSSYYDGKEVKPVPYKEGKKVMPEKGKFLFCDALKFMASGAILKSVQELPLVKGEDVTIPPISACQGVPGSGKSHTLIQNVVTKQGESQDFIVVTGREQKQELESRLAKCKYPSPLPVATCDSVLINHGKYNKFVGCDRLFIDEVFMHHAGKVLILISILKPRTVHVLGDNKQVIFINRRGEAPTPLARVENIVRMGTPLNVSHRIPLDAVCAISGEYDFPVFGTSDVVRSLQWKQSGSITDYVTGDVKVLVHKQIDKIDSRIKQFNPNTIQEYQGNQHDHVVGFRSDPSKLALYDSANHINVLISRHLKTFTYVSNTKDLTVRKIESTLQKTDEQILKFKTQMREGFLELKGRSVCLDFPKDKWIAAPFVAGGPIQMMPGKFLSASSYEVNTNVPEKRQKLTEEIRENISSLFSGPQGHAFDVDTIEAERVETVKTDPVEVGPAKVDVGLLQDQYDKLFPMSSILDYDLDQVMFSQSGYEPKLENAIIIPGKEDVKIPIFEKMVPKLRTAVPKLREKTKFELCYAVSQRNCSVSKLRALSDEPVIAEEMVNKFFSTYVAREYEPLCADYETNPITIDAGSFDRWASSKEDFKLGLMTDDSPITYEDFIRYDLSIKDTCKPVLTQSCSKTYPAPQVIAAQSQRCNALFGPYVRAAVDRLLSILDPTFSIFIDQSPSDYETLLSERFPASKLASAAKTELDISKYDKSQGVLAILVIVGVFRRLGVPEYICDAMYESHRYTVLTSRNLGVKIYIDTQMKSGVAWTLAGNTIVNMSVMAAVFPLHELVSFRSDHALMNEEAHVGFVGDDSFVLAPTHFHRDLSMAYATLFNLEVKVLTFETLSFCSKFIFCEGDRFVFIPDVVKVLMKLGRNDLTNPDHVEEYRISLYDNLKNLNDVKLHKFITQIVQERYETDMDTSALCSELFIAVSSKENFQQLFELPKGKICLDPSLKKISKM